MIDFTTLPIGTRVSHATYGTWAFDGMTPLGSAAMYCPARGFLAAPRDEWDQWSLLIPPPPKPKPEYTTRDIPSAHLRHGLNEAAAEGWRLHTVMPEAGHRHLCVFERETRDLLTGYPDDIAKREAFTQAAAYP